MHYMGGTLLISPYVANNFHLYLQEPFAKAVSVWQAMNFEIKKRWAHFWMRYASSNRKGRMAAFLAWIVTPGYKDLVQLSYRNRRGFIHPFASINHSDLRLGKGAYIDYNVTLYSATGGGPIKLDSRVRILRGCIFETGDSGYIEVGEYSWVNPNTQIAAYIRPVIIGKKVLVAANCSFYPHNHGIKGQVAVFGQKADSKGPIMVGDGSWLGVNVTVLGGVTIGENAVIGAGSVVTRNVPPNSIAAGSPARILKYR